jgi:UDPglucose 6-dehydrogenase
MKVCVIGTGYVGLVTAACLSDSGNHVIGVDKDADKVARLARGESIIFEPGLSDLLARNLKAKRLSFTTDLAPAVAQSRVAFIAVGTPPKADGTADLSAVEAVAAAIGQALTHETVIVNKSTVPVGTGSRVEAIVAQHTQHPFAVVSNPEFLKEGTAIDDFMRPDRVVVGSDDQAAGDVIEELHQPFVRNAAPILRISRLAAEMAKYAANAYLATRISFINEIAAVCERFDVDVNQVRHAIGTDARIGRHFMYPGLGYGGSCFPKDVQALASIARDAGVECDILEAVHRRNLAMRRQMIEKILARLGPDLTGQTLAVWGLAFKPKTDDVREAPALSIIQAARAAGAAVNAHDPEANDTARAALQDDGIVFHENGYDALDGADALVICTEWNEFRSPDFNAMARRLKQPLVFDGRNLYENQAMQQHHFEYYSVGRPPVTPTTTRS